MTALTYTLGVLLFVVGVLVSVGLHEAGHMVPAKRFGVRVTQYMVGFGPTVWSRRRGETEYGLKAIPLGGYCKLVGMVPPVMRRVGRISTVAHEIRHVPADTAAHPRDGEAPDGPVDDPSGDTAQERDTLIVAMAGRGIDPRTIADMAEVTDRTVYRVLARHKEREDAVSA